MGRSIKKGALKKSSLSFMIREKKEKKLKCMLLGFVSEHFMWFGIDSFFKSLLTKKMVETVKLDELDVLKHLKKIYFLVSAASNVPNVNWRLDRM